MTNRSPRASLRPTDLTALRRTVRRRERVNGKRPSTYASLGSIELTALRDIANGLPMFVPARRTDLLIAQGLASRRLDGSAVLTDEGLRRIKDAAADESPKV
jgi:hypothetical protein